jgi:hypothetical protein
MNGEKRRRWSGDQWTTTDPLSPRTMTLRSVRFRADSMAEASDDGCGSKDFYSYWRRLLFRSPLLILCHEVHEKRGKRALRKPAGQNYRWMEKGDELVRKVDPLSKLCNLHSPRPKSTADHGAPR